MNEQSLSLRKVARAAGLDPSFFSKVLSGKRSPPSNEKILIRLAHCLKMDPVLLIISTGTIPSQLQSAMENPDFLESVRDRARFRTAALPKGASRPANLNLVRSHDLSTDLL